MVILFMECTAIALVLGLILGIFMSEKTIDNLPEKLAIVASGGVIIGIIVFIIGIFSHTGEYEEQSYTDWHGLIVKYEAEVTSDKFYWGIFIGLFSIVGALALIIGSLVGRAIRDKVDTLLSNTSEEKKGKIKKSIVAICLILVGVFITSKIVGSIAASRAQQAKQVAIEKAEKEEEAKIEEQYSEAERLFEEGNYSEAISLYEKLKDYKDSQDKVIIATARQVPVSLDEKDYESAKDYIFTLNYTTDVTNPSIEREIDTAFDAYYKAAIDLTHKKKYKLAQEMFEQFDDYKHSDRFVDYCLVARDVSSIEEGSDLTDIYEEVKDLHDFNEADKLITNNKYLSQIKSWEGTWKVISSGTDQKKIVIKRGLMTRIEEFDEVDRHFTIRDGKIVTISGDDDEYGTITVNGNQMVYNDSNKFDFGDDVCVKQ